MFIEEVMSRIWEPEYKRYDQLYKQALELDANKLYEKVSGGEMGMIHYPGLTMNLLSTSGCPHRFKKDKISGCSMCDYQSDFVISYAAMKALRKKDVSLYAKAVKDSFVNVRGTGLKANAFELITGNDCFSEEEFPDEVLKELFLPQTLFFRPPFRYILEARASSVTKERLELLAACLGPKTRVMIELGLESGNDWIRNHWINKNVTNAEIETAVKLIHEQGYKVSMDIIIGIPGLTEQQSIDLFKEAVIYADDLGVDEIIFLPLNRKEGTLQGFIHRELKDNIHLMNTGLVNREHTGIPWLFTIVEAVFQALDGREGILSKLNFAQLSPDKNLIRNKTPYNAGIGCECNINLLEAISRLKEKNGYELFIQARKEMRKDSCFDEYENLLNRQKSCGDLKQTIKILGKELVEVLWPEEGDKYYHHLLDELELQEFKTIRKNQGTTI